MSGNVKTCTISSTGSVVFGATNFTLNALEAGKNNIANDMINCTVARGMSPAVAMNYTLAKSDTPTANIVHSTGVNATTPTFAANITTTTKGAAIG